MAPVLFLKAGLVPGQVASSFASLSSASASTAPEDPIVSSPPPPEGWQPPPLDLEPSALPPLPPVNSRKLAHLARTHKSSGLDRMHGTHSDNYLAELGSNRRLEWEGDACLHWLVSLKLATLLENASSGDLTDIRSRITSNRTFSHLAWHYGLTQQSVIGTPQQGHVAANVGQKGAANAFEAYLGAVVEANVSNKRPERAVVDYLDKLITPKVFPQLAELRDELKLPLEPWKGEDQHKRRKLTTVFKMTDSLRGGSDGQSRSTPTKTHTWIESYAPADKWTCSLEIGGVVVGVGKGSNLVHARDAALEAYLEDKV
ncbi:hypothetical protein JCM5296_006680 [Sporobolomyces johnsonii]